MSLSREQDQICFLKQENAVLKRELADAERAEKLGNDLAKRLREIENDEGFQSVWTLHYAHGMTYSGPNWSEPLKALEDFITERARQREEEER